MISTRINEKLFLLDKESQVSDITDTSAATGASMEGKQCPGEGKSAVSKINNDKSLFKSSKANFNQKKVN